MVVERVDYYSDEEEYVDVFNEDCYHHIKKNLYKHSSNLIYLQFFLIHLRLLGKITAEDIDRELGRYFKIPKCCINFFTLCSKYGVIRVAEFSDKLFGEDKNTQFKKYVRCPKCRIDSEKQLS